MGAGAQTDGAGPEAGVRYAAVGAEDTQLTERAIVDGLVDDVFDWDENGLLDFRQQGANRTRLRDAWTGILSVPKRPKKRPIALVAASNEQKDDFFKRLSSERVPLSDLVYQVPNLVRGSQLLDALVRAQVPLLRASWVIKIIYHVAAGPRRTPAAANAKRPGHEWLDSLRAHLVDLAARAAAPAAEAARALQAPPQPPQPSPQASSVSSAPPQSLSSAQSALERWHYVAELLCWGIRDGVVPRGRALSMLIDLAAEAGDLPRQPQRLTLWLSLCAQLLPEFCRVRTLAHRLWSFCERVRASPAAALIAANLQRLVLAAIPFVELWSALPPLVSASALLPAGNGAGGASHAAAVQAAEQWRWTGEASGSELDVYVLRVLDAARGSLDDVSKMMTSLSGNERARAGLLALAWMNHPSRAHLPNSALVVRGVLCAAASERVARFALRGRGVALGASPGTNRTTPPRRHLSEGLVFTPSPHQLQQGQPLPQSAAACSGFSAASLGGNGNVAAGASPFGLSPPNLASPPISLSPARPPSTPLAASASAASAANLIASPDPFRLLTPAPSTPVAAGSAAAPGSLVGGGNGAVSASASAAAAPAATNTAADGAQDESDLVDAQALLHEYFGALEAAASVQNDADAGDAKLSGEALARTCALVGMLISDGLFSHDLFARWLIRKGRIERPDSVSRALLLHVPTSGCSLSESSQRRTLLEAGDGFAGREERLFELAVATMVHAVVAAARAEALEARAEAELEAVMELEDAAASVAWDDMDRSAFADLYAAAVAPQPGDALVAMRCLPYGLSVAAAKWIWRKVARAVRETAASPSRRAKLHERLAVESLVRQSLALLEAAQLWPTLCDAILSVWHTRLATLHGVVLGAVRRHLASFLLLGEGPRLSRRLLQTLIAQGSLQAAEQWLAAARLGEPAYAAFLRELAAKRFAAPQGPAPGIVASWSSAVEDTADIADARTVIESVAAVGDAVPPLVVLESLGRLRYPNLNASAVTELCSCITALALRQSNADATAASSVASRLRRVAQCLHQLRISVERSRDLRVSVGAEFVNAAHAMLTRSSPPPAATWHWPLFFALAAARDTVPLGLLLSDLVLALARRRHHGAPALAAALLSPEAVAALLPAERAVLSASLSVADAETVAELLASLAAASLGDDASATLPDPVRQQCWSAAYACAGASAVCSVLRRNPAALFRALSSAGLVRAGRAADMAARLAAAALGGEEVGEDPLTLLRGASPWTASTRWARLRLALESADVETRAAVAHALASCAEDEGGDGSGGVGAIAAAGDGEAATDRSVDESDSVRTVPPPAKRARRAPRAAAASAVTCGQMLARLGGDVAISVRKLLEESLRREMQTIVHAVAEGCASVEQRRRGELVPGVVTHMSLLLASSDAQYQTCGAEWGRLSAEFDAAMDRALQRSASSRLPGAQQLYFGLTTCEALASADRHEAVRFLLRQLEELVRLLGASTLPLVAPRVTSELAQLAGARLRCLLFCLDAFGDESALPLAEETFKVVLLLLASPLGEEDATRSVGPLLVAALSESIMRCSAIPAATRANFFTSVLGRYQMLRRQRAMRSSSSVVVQFPGLYVHGLPDDETPDEPAIESFSGNAEIERLVMQPGSRLILRPSIAAGYQPVS